ncbi:DUF1576 domain-containing protein [uncultured Acetatifactor sp.]|uniref:DUF1576 domain-containing protein n=1 Tax=uncultured Acetatifactor sp. TaxID=1671927 RepID=UPI00262D2D17|nr:DUF1576 domain-containing protein [uncultured Acetatifactor sp.]
MGGRTVRERLQGRELKVFSFCSMALLLAAGAAGMVRERASLADAVKGLWVIVISRDALITDYFGLAGYASAFLNAVLVMGMGLWLLCREKVKFTGLTMAAVFINVGYALWGKNPVNILPILVGTSAYALVHGSRLSRYIYTGFFGTSLAPLVTELVFELPFGRKMNFLVAIAVGILIGFILPALSVHTASMHMGYNLFNVGFSAGILAFVVVCVLKSFGIESESVLIWREGRPLWIVVGLFGYFALTFLYGLYLCGGRAEGLLKVWKHPGRAVADFVLMEGPGNTLMNMALVGALCAAYICLIGGDFSGPVVGAILTAFGFSAFGAHVRNYAPVLAGVYLSTLLNRFEPTTPGVQLAAAFAVGLAPIAGRFGVIAGIVAGMLHTAIVMCTSQMYGGLNLYNNGFSAGWVAIIMVPAIESFLMEYGRRKRRDTDA